MPPYHDASTLSPGPARRGWTAPRQRIVALTGGVLALVGAILISGCGEDSAPARPELVGLGMFGAGIRGSVQALAVYEDDLIAAGYYCGPADTVCYVARWNGSRWEQLGSGLGGPVLALCAYGGSLYAGGRFLRREGAPSDHLARWDGERWNSVAGFPDGPVLALRAYRDRLLAGGNFTRAGHAATRNVAAWDADLETWEVMGAGLDGAVTTFAEFEGRLIAGGSFGTDQGEGPAGLAVWTGSEWTAFARGVREPGVVTALVQYDGALVVGGQFRECGGLGVQNIAAWDGRIWSRLGSGCDQQVLDLLVHGDCLLAAGLFRVAGSASSPYLARWNGLTWTGVPLALNRQVNALGTFDGRVVVAGDFTTVDAASLPGVVSLGELGCPAGGAPPVAVDLLVNGGAEEGTTAPSGWSRYDGNTDAFRTEWGATAQDGLRSLTIQAPSTPSGSGDFAHWSQRVSAHEVRGKPVDLVASIKLDRVDGFGVALAIRCDDTDPPEGNAEMFVTTQGLYPIRGTFDWRPHQITLPLVPGDTEVITIYLLLLGPSSGTAHFDRISLSPVE